MTEINMGEGRGVGILGRKERLWTLKFSVLKVWLIFRGKHWNASTRSLSVVGKFMSYLKNRKDTRPKFCIRNDLILHFNGMMVTYDF